MNPLSLVLKLAGTAFIGGAFLATVMKKLGPSPSDLMAGAIHFWKGLEEFQKGIGAVVFGASGESLDRLKKERESSRIPIE